MVVGRRRRRLLLLLVLLLLLILDPQLQKNGTKIVRLLNLEFKKSKGGFNVHLAAGEPENRESWLVVGGGSVIFFFNCSSGPLCFPFKEVKPG